MTFNPHPKPGQIILTGAPKKRLDAEIIKRDNDQCGICGAVPDPGNHFTAHHIKYRSAGGDDVRGNKISACPACHTNAHQHRVDRGDRVIKFKSKQATMRYLLVLVADLETIAIVREGFKT